MKLTKKNIVNKKKSSKYKISGWSDRYKKGKKYQGKLSWEEIEEIPTIDKKENE